MRAASTATAATLAGIGAIHVAWGTGSAFPLADRDELADAVVGSDSVPGPAASFAVAALLGVAAGLVADVLPVPRRVRAVGVGGAAAVLAVRSAFGLAGRTELLVPGSNSARFVALDRRFYAPLCGVLALGALASLGGGSHRSGEAPARRR